MKLIKSFLKLVALLVFAVFASLLYVEKWGSSSPVERHIERSEASPLDYYTLGADLDSHMLRALNFKFDNADRAWIRASNNQRAKILARGPIKVGMATIEGKRFRVYCREFAFEGILGRTSRISAMTVSRENTFTYYNPLLAVSLAPLIEY